MWSLLLLLACAQPPASAPSASPAPPPVAAAPAADAVRVVFLGDSLTAGYGLSAELAFPALIQQSLTQAGLSVKVSNAGVSGDTTAGGLRRLDWLLQQKPDVLVVALGGNDMLRGLPPEETRTNLKTILSRAQAAGATVLLAGMRAMPTLGPAYVSAFNAIYPELSAELGVTLLPFLLEGVAGDPALNQADGIHPTAEGQQRIAAQLAPLVEAAVRQRNQP